MKLSNIRDSHFLIFEKLGIKTQDKPYEQCVEELIFYYLQSCQEIKKTDKEFFQQELYKIKTDRRN